MSYPLALPAVMYVNTNPLLPAGQGKATHVVPGTLLKDLTPDYPCVVLRLNGQFLLRVDWNGPVLPGDVIEWFIVFHGGGGRGGSRTILTIVAAIAIQFFVPGNGLSAALLRVGLNIAANALINALIPIQSSLADGGGGAAPSPTYNVSVSGNQARLYQPIPVIYGRHQIYPDFACQPYSEYENNDQYFYAVYCIGMGEYTFERKLIDDTFLSRFSDVSVEELPPNDLPNIARANVVTAIEVSGQELLSGRYVGAFSVCNAKLSVESIGVDLVCSRGLGIANDDGSFGNKTVEWRVEYRVIDDFGTATTPWAVLATEALTRNTSDVQRISYRYTLPAAERIEVRLVRLDEKDDNARVLNDLEWAGLRGYLSVPATLCPQATHMAIKIRASEQLNGLSQRRISVIVRRKISVRGIFGEDDDYTWSANQESRSIVWALADLWRNDDYGDGLEDERLDLDTLQELDLVYESRQDRLDIVFDTKITSWEAAKIISQCGRAAPIRRNGVNTLMRDQQQDLPITAFTTRDMLPESFSMSYALANENTADAVYLEYFSNRTWSFQEVQCYAPGVITPQNPVRVRMEGVTGLQHATREGLYMAAVNLYRRRFPSWETEMQGILPAFGSPVVISPSLPGWGQSGDVVAWDETGLVITLSEDAEFTEEASHYISLIRDDGSVTDAIAVTPGAAPNQIVLASAPDFDLVVDSAYSERPKYIFGSVSTYRMMVRVLGISRKGKNNEGAMTYAISAVVEDNRVHQADNAHLPSGSEIQDPVVSPEEVPEEGPGGGTQLVIVNFLDHKVAKLHLPGEPSIKTVGFTLRQVGTMFLNGVNYANDTQAGNFTNEWMRYTPVEPTDAARFDVMVTQINTGTITGSGNNASYTDLTAGTLDSWLIMNQDYTWSLTLDMDFVRESRAVKLRVQFREIATGIIVEDRTVLLVLEYTYLGGD